MDLIGLMAAISCRRRQLLSVIWARIT